MKTISFAIIFSLMLFGCCSVGGGGNIGATDTFRPQGTRYASGDIVNAAAKLSAEQVSAIALAGIPGVVDSLVFGSENGKAMYEVTIINMNGAKSISHVDATSGEVLRITH